jgi:hypothetical protein
MDLGRDSGWSRTLDAGGGVSPSERRNRGSESGTVILRGVIQTRRAQEATASQNIGGGTRGDWLSQVGDLSQLLVLTVGSV